MYFREKGYFTLVGRKAQCISACFFMFIGGYDLETKQIARFKEVDSTLGVHQSALNIAPGSYSDIQLGLTIQAHQMLVLEIIKYLMFVSVDFKMLTYMLMTEPGKVFKIDNRDAADNNITIENCSRLNVFKTLDCSYQGQ